jgi:hypothetical protein
VISVFCALVSTTEIRHVSLAEENESEVQEWRTVWYKDYGHWEEIPPYTYSSIKISLSNVEISLPVKGHTTCWIDRVRFCQLLRLDSTAET